MSKVFKKINLVGLVAVMLFVLFTSVQPSNAQDAVRIGTSSVGSVFYTLAIGASEVITKHAGINATAEPLGGSTANVYGLGAKKIEFSLANAFASFSGYHGTHTFKKPVDIRLVVQGQPSYRFLLARRGAEIKTPEDLIGKTVVAKRRALPELEILMNAYIKAFNLPKDKIKIVATTNTNEAIKVLRAGSVDAAILPFSRRSAQVGKPMQDKVIEFLYISEEKRDEMLKYLPKAMYGGYFKPGTYAHQDKPVYHFGMNTYFLTRTGVSEDTVYRVAKAIMDHTKEFSTYHKAGAQWTSERALKNVALPFHDGSIRYFKEKGLWTPELEANQKQLLSQR
jgi:TRAP transporter TAXI family solute receptor